MRRDTQTLLDNEHQLLQLGNQTIILPSKFERVTIRIMLEKCGKYLL